MKKFRFILTVLLTATLLSGCGAPSGNENRGHGLVTDEVTTDPSATRVEVPHTSDTSDDVNVRNDDTVPSQKDPTSPQNPTDGETRIHFLAAGDNIIHENVFLDARARAKSGEEYNFIDMYDGVADKIAAADLAFINQETPIGGDALGISGYPNFNSPEVVGDTLIELGFDIINIATNHMLDKSEKGYRGALEYWSGKDALMIGGYKDRTDYENIRIIEEQGVTIAFLAYTYDTNKMYLPKSSELYVPYIDEAEIVTMTKKARGVADLVFVVMHWGGENENSHTPSTSQRQLAAAITEAGADVILGGHPHVIQPMEWLSASDGSKTLVIYSLGNFISTQYNNRNLVGGMATFDIVKDKTGKITIENPVYNPTVTHYNMERLGLQIYMMEDYTDELCKLHGTQVFGQTDKTWTLPLIRSYATKNVAAEFLPSFLNS